MNVLWLAPLPLVDAGDSHPAPWIITLAKALVSKGIRLTIVNNSPNIDEEISRIEYENIKIVYVKTPGTKMDFLTLYQLKIQTMRRFLREIISDFDILHIHGTEHQYEAMSEGLKIPKVVSIQGIMGIYIDYLPKDNLKQYLQWRLAAWYETFYLSKNSAYSCRTAWDSSYIRAMNPQAKIYMVWEMIREEFFHDNFSAKKKNILFVGGKNPIKGLKELLVAYDRSIQSLGFKLIVLGDCSIDVIKGMIEIQGLDSITIDNIDCRGMQDSSGMVRAYQDSYCLVHPTYIDNSPNSVCEAQISGLPVIATDVGGVSSLIEDQKTGLLIDRSPEAIEHAVKKLYEDGALRESISRESRQMARRRHDHETILSQTIAMYTDVINAKV